MRFTEKLTQFLLELKESLCLFIANHLPRFSAIDRSRYLFLRTAGMNIPEWAEIRSPLEVRPVGAAKRITIGKDALINSGVRFAGGSAIDIGSRVLVGPRVCFETVNHSLTFSASGRRLNISKPITVEDDVWIGAGAIILPGVHIKRGAVVAAGAVVNRDVAAYTLVGGVPARLIKKIEEGTVIDPHDINRT
jgi:maltose O-acetyltransferase